MSAYTFTQADGSDRVVHGYKYAPPPAGHKRYTLGSARAASLPAKVDLRSAMTDVEDQKNTNSCAANATAGAYEYLIKRHMGDEAYDVSRLFIYYNARAVVDPENIEDEGSVLHNVIGSLKENGACSEQTWPFEPESVNEAPSEDAYEEAKGFLIEETELVPTELEAWKGALAAGHPIIFGMKLFDSFDKQKKAGLVPMPTEAEGGRQSHGGHAMLCVGYSDPDEVFIVRNSWGPGWGDKGYCYIPYRYLMNPDFNFGDSWIIKQIEVLPPDESTWSEDEESVLEDVSGVLAGMSDDEFQVLLHKMGKVPLEVRLALLFLHAAGADGEITDEEGQSIVAHITPVLEQLGSRTSPEKLLRNTLRHLEDAALLEHTVDVLGGAFSPEVLASIAGELQAIAGADGEVSEDEQAFVDGVIARWQVHPVEADAADDDEVEDEEGDEEDDEESDEEDDAEEEDGEEEDAEEEDGEEEDGEDEDAEDEGDEEEGGEEEGE
jgi:hypothetical protein